MSRKRFYWMLGFLGIALAIAVTATMSRIQQDLLMRGQEAIAAAEIPYYGLRIDGRDAVLGGFVTEGTDIARLASVVSQVPGIRTVRNEVTVERITLPANRAYASGRGTIALTTATRPPELRVQRLGCLLIVTGTLPADGSAATLEQVLRSRFPAVRFRIDVRADEAVSAREWTSHIGLLADAMVELDGPSRLAAYGNSVQLSGQIANSSKRAALDDILARAPGVDWRLTLTLPSGSIGGAP